MVSLQQSNIRLGSGAFGSVRVVRHIGENKLYALKDQPLNYWALEEVLILAKVRGVHTVHMYSYFWNHLQTRMYIVQEYYRGGSLRTFLQALDGPMAQEETKFYAAQLVLAVIRIHQQGVGHRDLHSNNILIADDGYLQIADFGVAATLAGDSSSLVRDWMYVSTDLFHMSTGLYYWWWEIPWTNNMLFTMCNFCLIGGSKPSLSCRLNSGIDFIKDLYSNPPTNKAAEMRLKAHPWFKNYTAADWLAVGTRKKTSPFTLQFDGKTMVYQPSLRYGRTQPIHRAKTTYSLANFAPVVDKQEY